MNLRRNKQFATLHPCTKTRFDVGITQKGIEPSNRPAAHSLRKRRMNPFIIAAVFLWVVPLDSGAQSANFAGIWVATRDTPAAVGLAPTAVLDDRFEITVTPDAITLSRLLRGAALAVVLPISGDDVRTAVPGRSCMSDVSLVSSMRRHADTLVYHVANVSAGTTQPLTPVKYSMYFEAPDRLVVASIMRTNAQSGPVAMGTVYRRSAEPMPPPLPTVRGAAADIARIAWMAGDWEGPLGTSIQQERWTTPAGGSMLAINRTIRANTMSAFEFLCINERAGTLVFSARPNAGTPTDFVLTHVDVDSATFENPTHDFPKRIRYVRRADGSMSATISGTAGQQVTTFTFTKRQP